MLTKLHINPSCLCRHSGSLPCSPSSTGLECLFCGLHGDRFDVWQASTVVVRLPVSGQLTSASVILEPTVSREFLLCCKGVRRGLGCSLPHLGKGIPCDFLPQSYRRSGTGPTYFQFPSYSVQYYYGPREVQGRDSAEFLSDASSCLFTCFFPNLSL